MDENVNGTQGDSKKKQSDEIPIELWSIGSRPSYHNSYADRESEKEREELRKLYGYKEDDPDYLFMSKGIEDIGKGIEDIGKGIEKWQEKRKKNKILRNAKKLIAEGQKEIEKIGREQTGVMITRADLHAFFAEEKPFRLILRIGTEPYEIGYRFAETCSRMKYFERFYCKKQLIDMWYNGFSYQRSLDEFWEQFEEIAYGQNEFELLRFDGVKVDKTNWKKAGQYESLDRYITSEQTERIFLGGVIASPLIGIAMFYVALLLFKRESFFIIPLIKGIPDMWIELLNYIIYLVMSVLGGLGLCFFVIGLFVSIPGEFIERRKWKKVGNWSFYTPDYVYEKMQKENQTTAMYQGKKIRIEHIMSFRDIDYSSIPREYIDSDLLILDKDKDCIQDLYVVGNKKFYFKEDFLQALKSLDEGQGICCFQLRDPILIPRS